MRQIIAILGRITSIILPDPIRQLVDDRYAADMIRGNQMASILRNTPSLMKASLINVMFACVVLYSTAEPIELFLWASVSSIFICMGYLNVRRHHGAFVEARPTSSTKKATRNAFVLGMIWAAIPILFFHDATLPQKIYIVCVTAGMMGGGALAFAILPGTASAFCLTIAAGAFITLVQSSDIILITTSFLVVVYGYALIQSVNEHGSRFVTVRLNEVEIEKSNQTIGMLLKQFQDASSDWMWRTDEDHRFVNPSERFCEVVDGEVPDLGQISFREISQALSLQQENCLVIKDTVPIWGLMDDRLEFHEVLLKLNIKGTERWWRCSGQPLFDSHGEFDGYRGVASDATEQIEAQLKLDRLARYDHLTGLMNRTEFTNQLSKYIRGCTEQSKTVGLLYIDLDKFKTVNDTLGHAIGDEVLREAASRIFEVVGNNARAARFGGDEFVVGIRCEDGLAEAVRTAQLIIQMFTQPLEIKGHSLSFGASIGVALASGPLEAATDLINKADLALYRAKKAGRGRFEIYADSMDLAQKERRELETELRSASKNDELELYYQPLADIESGKLIGFEALLRWNNPKRGVVYPDSFNSLAEDTGLIHEIGEWVIDRACNDAKSWQGELKVAVNLSGKQLSGNRIIKSIIAALEDSGLPPERLEIEVTESVLLGDPEFTMNLLNKMRNLGVKISLDDFGTGYSSLSYLVRFPFDKLKIDRYFVQSADVSPENLAIIRAILSLARDLNITTLAEGVETPAQLNMLHREGCQQMQGYLISKPMPFSRTREFCERQIQHHQSGDVLKNKDAA